MHKFFLLLFLLGGCSFFIGKIDNTIIKEKDYQKNIPETPTYCPLDTKSSVELVGTSENSQTVFYELLQNKNLKLDFLDTFALWTLLQMAIRPDQTSPTARFQTILRVNGENSYYDFFSELPGNQFPLFYGLEWVLKKHGKKTKLEYYAKILQKNLKEMPKVTKVLENFLNQNAVGIKNQQQLATFFMRGAEVLKEDERMPVLDFSEAVRIYRQHEPQQKIIVNNSLTPFVTEAGNKGNCNYDFNLYDNSIFLIDKIIPVANLFGLSNAQGAFMASTSQKLSQIGPIDNLPLFKGESKIRSSAVCLIENNTNQIWTFSNQSRDPGQHLFHLIRYGLSRSQSTAEVDKLLRHSRHLFLSDPVRLIIESHRSNPEQIENLLKLNLPIYNAEKLGNIWAFTQFGRHNRFLIDDRNVGSYLCK